jgi:uncharacterized protein (TIGR03000 family)
MIAVRQSKNAAQNLRFQAAMPNKPKVPTMCNTTRWFTKVALAAAIVLSITPHCHAQRGGGHGGMGGGGGGMGHGGSWGGAGWGHGGWGRGGGWYGGGFYGGFYGDPYYYGPYYYGGLPYYYPPPVAPIIQPAPIVMNPGIAMSPGYEAEQLAPPRPADNTAIIEVQVPADAEVWFDGTKTSQRGTNRLFTSPPLAPEQTYTYEIRAAWTVNGTPATKTFQVQVAAGKRSWVSFVDTAPVGK